MALKTRYTNVGGQVAAVKTGGQRYFVEPDALGNVRGLVNQSGVRSQTYTYWPYGEVRTSTGSVSQPLQFCGTWGYYTESSTKQYVRARYYMQSIGSWQTVDPLWPGEMPYGYVEGEPATSVDAQGRQRDNGSGKTKTKPFPWPPGGSPSSPYPRPNDTDAIEAVGQAAKWSAGRCLGSIAGALMPSVANPVNVPYHYVPNLPRLGQKAGPQQCDQLYKEYKRSCGQAAKCKQGDMNSGYAPGKQRGLIDCADRRLRYFILCEGPTGGGADKKPCIHAGEACKSYFAATHCNYYMRHSEFPHYVLKQVEEWCSNMRAFCKGEGDWPNFPWKYNY